METLEQTRRSSFGLKQLTGLAIKRFFNSSQVGRSLSENWTDLKHTWKVNRNTLNLQGKFAEGF